MTGRLTQKQETFCLKYFELGNASEAARIALYSPKTAATIGAENLLKPKIIERIAEMRQAAEDATIATVVERKQVLSEIARGRLGDFINVEGELVEVSKENLRSASLQELRTTHLIGKDDQPTHKSTTIKLHNPIQAIAELNKMERVYETAPSVAIDNRTLTINVSSEKAKELTHRLIEGERTESE